MEVKCLYISKDLHNYNKDINSYTEGAVNGHNPHQDPVKGSRGGHLAVFSAQTLSLAKLSGSNSRTDSTPVSWVAVGQQLCYLTILVCLGFGSVGIEHSLVHAKQASILAVGSIPSLQL